MLVFGINVSDGAWKSSPHIAGIPKISDLSFYVLKVVIYLFLERGKLRDKERQRNITVREKQTLISCLL